MDGGYVDEGVAAPIWSLDGNLGLMSKVDGLSFRVGRHQTGESRDRSNTFEASAIRFVYLYIFPDYTLRQV